MVIRFPSASGTKHGNLLSVQVEEALNLKQTASTQVQQRKGEELTAHKDKVAAGTKIKQLNIENTLNIYNILSLHGLYLRCGV